MNSALGITLLSVGARAKTEETGPFRLVVTTMIRLVFNQSSLILQCTARILDKQGVLLVLYLIATGNSPDPL
jgi:hypothetical protein